MWHNLNYPSDYFSWFSEAPWNEKEEEEPEEDEPEDLERMIEEIR